VLYPAPIRDTLMWLAKTDLFRARWTDKIHDEWISSLLKKRPDLSPEDLAVTRQKMDSNVLDCLVTGYHDLISGLQLPDDGDRHVLAAAITCSADAIVTFNLKHFPQECLDKYGIEAIDPDDFVILQMGLSKHTVLHAVKKQRENLRNPPKTIDEFLSSLEQCGLVQTVSELRRYREFL